jgi:hypothetical protein
MKPFGQSRQAQDHIVENDDNSFRCGAGWCGLPGLNGTDIRLPCFADSSCDKTPTSAVRKFNDTTSIVLPFSGRKI